MKKKSSKKTISPKNTKLVWGPSGGKCSICRRGVIEEKADGITYTIGVMAHIEGENSTSARYNPKMSEEERSGYKNLLIVCPNCHSIIDNDTTTYTVIELQRIKSEHEKWVHESLRQVIADVTFVELEVIVKYLVSAPVGGDDAGLLLVAPRDKIRRNNLSTEVERLITLGLSQVKQVRLYQTTNLDLRFSERLRSGFLSKYSELRNSGLEGDSLFYAMLEFASVHAKDFKERAAALSVLVFFFEICDIFEK